MSLVPKDPLAHGCTWTRPTPTDHGEGWRDEAALTGLTGGMEHRRRKRSRQRTPGFDRWADR